MARVRRRGRARRDFCRPARVFRSIALHCAQLRPRILIPAELLCDSFADRSRVYGTGFLSYFLAIFVWTVDLNFCWFLDAWLPAHGAPNPQLHAAWHVLVSNGFARLLACLAWRRARDLGHAGARFEWRCLGLLPTVDLGKKEA